MPGRKGWRVHGASSGKALKRWKLSWALKQGKNSNEWDIQGFWSGRWSGRECTSSKEKKIGSQRPGKRNPGVQASLLPLGLALCADIA